MFRVANFVQYAPCRSGLYETTREVTGGMCEHLKWNARMIDMTGCIGKGDPVKKGEDRGVLIDDLDWAAKADVHVLHTGIPGELLGTKPMYYFAHGLPEDMFYSQIMSEVNISEATRLQKAKRSPTQGTWSLVDDIRQKEWCRGAITLWKRHCGFLEPYFKNVILANHFCDLQHFVPDGKKITFITPAREGALNITFADHWRYTTRKDPFWVLHGVRKFCQETGSRVHLFAVPTDEIRQIGHPWNSVIHGVSNELSHTIGDFYSVHDDIASVHRAADLLITPSCDDTRTVIESSACGCPVLARHGAHAASYHCQMEFPDEVDGALRQIYKDIRENRDQVKKQARALAEGFQLKDAMMKIEEGIKESL
jgi:glycosyltransferase involved in cell wall biosynthesis